MKDITEEPHVKDRHVSPLRAEGGISTKVKLRQMDIDRLNHMKLFFEREFGIRPSITVLLRRMCEDYSGYIDGMIETCNMLGKRHIVEARFEKESLVSATRDEPRSLPKLDLGPDDLMPTFSERRDAFMKEVIEKSSQKLRDFLANGSNIKKKDDHDPYD